MKLIETARKGPDHEIGALHPWRGKTVLTVPGRCYPAIRSSHSFGGTLFPQQRACHDPFGIVVPVIGGWIDKRGRKVDSSHLSAL